MDVINANVRKCVALVVGISNYDHRPKLKNAVNDAKAIAEAFEKLKYEVHLLLDATKSKFDDELSQIMQNGFDYDVVVIYFAGHGMYCNLADCIIFKDAIKTNDTAALLKSWKIEGLYQDIRGGTNGLIIAIIDACRVDVIIDDTEARGSIDPKFASHIKLPFQTFIAFATSPHTTAKDGLKDHSPYTQALLEEIPVLNQPIETTFKNVRRKLYKGIGDQLPWEHSCLTDEVSFNFGQCDPHYGSIYSSDVFYNPKGLNEISTVKDIKTFLDDGNFSGLVTFVDSNVRAILSESYDVQFIIGRILTTAFGVEMSLSDSILSKQSIDRFFNGEINHLFNGILYEQYFDSNDRPRIHGLTDRLYDVIFNVIGDSQYKDSKNFIQHELSRIDYKGYIPGVEIEKRFQAQLIENETSYGSGESNLFLTKLSLKSMPIEFDISELGVRFTIREFRQFLLQKSHCPSMLFGLRIDGPMDIEPDDLVILGNYDDTILINALDKYFNEENRSNIDELCHHYELCDIESYDVLDFTVSDDMILVRGGFSISTVLYFDNEDDTRTDITLDGTFEIHLHPNQKGINFELEPLYIEAQIDTSEYYR